MKQKADKIMLNEILKLNNLNNVKIRFNLQFKGNWTTIKKVWDSVKIAVFCSPQRRKSTFLGLSIRKYSPNCPPFYCTSTFAQKGGAFGLQPYFHNFPMKNFPNLD